MFDFSGFPRLETERLTLRRIVADDVPTFSLQLSNPSVMRYLLDFDQMLDSNGHATPLLQWAASIFRDHMGVAWSIERRADQALIGSMGFGEWNRQHQWAEVGYFFGESYWGQGYASEALTALCEFGFGEGGLRRIEASVLDGNAASVRVLEKNNFIAEGRQHQKVLLAKQPIDLLLFGRVTE